MRADLMRGAALSALLALCVAPAGAQTVPVPGSAPAPAEEPAAERSPTVNLVVPLREGRIFRGEVDIRVAPDGSDLAVDARQLRQLFEGRITQVAADQLLVAANGDGFVDTAEARAANLDLRFDTAAVEVVATFGAQSRSLTELSLSNRGTRPVRTGRNPEGISAYVNTEVFLTADDFSGSYDINDPTFDFDGAVHIAPLQNLVIEGGASISADGDFRRSGVRGVLFADDGSWRARAGDVGLSTLSYMSGSSILGAEFTNRAQFLSRQNTVRSIGDRSFFLDRPAVARLIVNGIENRTFNLDPGPYEVSDFPLADGANNVVFIIEDDTGEIDRIEFDVFADVSLLAPGQYEYGVSGGIISEANGTDFDYDGDAVLSGFVEAGLTNNLSAGVGVQGTSDAQLGAAVARLGTPFGRVDAEAAVSNIDANGGTGYAGRVSWRKRFDIPNTFRDPSIGLSAEYRSEEFGGLFTENLFNDTEWRFNLSYSQFLPWDLSMGVGVGYNLNRVSEDDLTASLSLGRSFGAWTIRAEGRYDSSTSGDEDELQAFLRLDYDFNANSNAFVDYETNQNRVSAGYARTSERSGVGAWGYSVGATRSEDSDIGLSGSASYIANRFEVSATQSANVEQLGGGDGGIRSSLRIGSAIAYADGKVAVGRPIGSSFAILDTHPNLENRRVLAGVSGEAGEYTASSDFLGPALVPNIGSGFGNARAIPYDVDDLPLGYDLGQGVAQLAPRYRSGFGVEVGSAYTVTAIGNLLDEFGEPLVLKLGSARALDDPDAPSVEIFTNRSGRFGATGLGPGRWRLEMATIPALTYDLTVPADAVGLLRTGPLNPNEQ